MYLIYDDDPTHCARLRTLLLSDPNNAEQDIRTASTEADAIRHLSGDTAVLFQDIRLEHDENGIHFAEYIKRHYPLCLIVFITAYAQYWENVFSVMPSGFITKPFTKEKVARVVLNINHHLPILRPMIHIREADNKLVSLPAADVVFIENENRRTKFYDDYYVGRKPAPLFSSHYSIAEIEQFLPSCFVRCHVSYYINMNHIRELRRYEMILHNGKSILISQRRYKDVENAFFRFTSDKL